MDRDIELSKFKEDTQEYRLLPEDTYLEKPGTDPKRSHWSPPTNLDKFLVRVYVYFERKGFWCIFLSRIVTLITLAFVAFLVVFLSSFIDYGELRKTKSLSDSVHFSLGRIHPALWAVLALFGVFWLWQFVLLFSDIVDKAEIKRFFTNQLAISERELQTIEWSEVVQKICAVPRLCLTKTQEPLTPLDVAQMIMRKENYIIAMINRGVMDVRLPFTSSPFYTKTLEWSIGFAVWNHVFDENIIQARFLTANPAELMRNRMYVLGLLSIFLSPLIFAFLVTYYFFRYGEEVRNKPDVLGSRMWTRFAMWKFREYNELSHVFQARMNLSRAPASKYIAQFTSNLIAIIARLVSFVAGSWFIIFVVMTLIDDDLLLAGDLWGRNFLWYITVTGAVAVIARGLIPEDTFVFSPKKYLDEVCTHTHYCPKLWRTKAHDPKVLKEVTALYDYRVLILLRELLSVLVVPFILLFTLPKSAENIVRFFSEFTVNVTGVGHICSFANFSDMESHASVKYGATSSAPKAKRSKNGKLEKSVINFKVAHPQWQPSAPAQRMLDNLSMYMVQSVDPAQSAWGSAPPSVRLAASGTASSIGPGAANSMMLSLQPNEISRLMDSYVESHSAHGPVDSEQFYRSNSPPPSIAIELPQ